VSTTDQPTVRAEQEDIELLGQTLGRYKLLEKVGEGGCGVVYVAEQTEPVRRRVALKVIKLGMDTKAVVARFEAERQALAMMDHPNIAKVLDAGSTDAGRPYFVMELVRGIRITDYCDQNNLATKDRLDLFIKICQAIQHAHQKGIIHRDIKPSNILVTLHDGVPVPKVIDFGIAKATEGRLTDATVYTQLHQFIGTPAYMSPEQAEMSGLDVDTRSDVYSLGVLLYELLTGRTPFDANELMSQGIDAMRKTIREKEPVRPSTKVATLQGEELTTTAKRRSLDAPSLVHLLKGDLDWIVMKCLEKDRTRRYETANGLAADLKRHLENEPVVARPPSTVYRLQKAFRRNKLAFTAGAAVLLALLLGLLAASWQAVRATRAEREQSRLREAAEKASEREASLRRAADAAKTVAEEARSKAAMDRERAEGSERATRELLYFANMGLAQTAWEEGDIERLQRLLAETANDPQRGFEWFYWMRQLHRETLPFRGHLNEGVNLVEFSPDGQWIASSGSAYRFSFGIWGIGIKLWEAKSGQIRQELTEEGPVYALGFSPNSERLATLNFRSKLTVRNTLTGQIVREFNMTSPPEGRGWRGLAWAPDGSQILTADPGAVRLWHVATGAQLHQLTNAAGSISLFWFSAEGRPEVAVQDETGFTLKDFLSGQKIANFDALKAGGITMSRDGRRFAAKPGNLIVVFDAKTGEALQRWPAGDAPVYLMRLSDNGSVLAISAPAWNGTIRLYDVDSGAELGSLKGHTRPVMGLSFSPDPGILASASQDGTVKIWNWRELLEPASTFEPNPRTFVRLSDDASLAIVLTNRSPDPQQWVSREGNPNNPQSTLVDVEARVLETRSGRTRAVLPGLAGFVRFSPDGGRVVGVTTNGSRAQVWDSTTGRVLLRFNAQTNQFEALLFSPNGRQIAMAQYEPDFRMGTVKICDALTGEVRFTLGRSQFFLRPLAFSADGRWLLTGSSENPLCTLWNTATGRGESVIGDTTISGVTSAAFSPDGNSVVTVNHRDAVMRVQPAHSRESRETGGAFTLNTATARFVAFSPDGRRILSESDGTAKLWDAATGRDLLTLRTPKIAKCQFSPDGQAIISARADGTLIRYEAATPAEVAGWEAAERPATVRRLTDAARSSTSALFSSRRYLELESIARDTLKTLRSDPELDPANIVEFTLRLAASLLCRANVAKAKVPAAPAKELVAEAEGLLRGITNEDLANYLRSDQGWDLAAFLGQAGHWTQAEAFLARVTDAASTNRVAWQLRARVLAESGDLSGYDKIRARLLPGVSSVTDGRDVSAEIGTLTLLPLTAPEPALEITVDRAIASEADTDTLRWLHLMKGLIRYRQGNVVGAWESLDKARAVRGSGPPPSASFTARISVVSAMVLFRLGRPDEARATLAEGTAVFKPNWFSPEREALENGWSTEVVSDLLLREARELIEGK
jgi:serine/threonine protein kinase/WD40 repeat protein